MKIERYYKQHPYIHYSNCHEDIDFVASKVRGQPKTILSVASALDNCLALLLMNPQQIVAIDSNPAQIALCKLKKCAIQRLNYQDFLVLLGVSEGDSLEIYNKLKDFLDVNTAEYFDKNLFLISQTKLVHCGRFEYYFQLFKSKILPLVHSKKTVEVFMSAQNLAEQQQIYTTKFNNLRFRLMFKLFFSQFVMKRLGRDKQYFKYNQGNLAGMLKDKFQHGVFNNLNKNNPYLQYVVFNQFKTLPTYLQRENFEIIKQRIDRLQIKEISFEQEITCGNKYDFLYLSDIFEYMSIEKTHQISKQIDECLNDGAQVLFFNMMNERRLVGNLKEEQLDQTNDRAFYYKACYMYTKQKHD